MQMRHSTSDALKGRGVCERSEIAWSNSQLRREWLAASAPPQNFVTRPLPPLPMKEETALAESQSCVGC